jgi:hypothetical protein
MRNFKSFVLSVFALLTIPFFAPATSAHAQFPAYLHAISDLRSAREYLRMDTRPERVRAREFAIEQITRAIDEMKRAAMDDGKNPWQAPPAQSEGNEFRPIHSAERLLREARRDVDHGFDSPENRGLRERSIEHIDKALEALQPFM